MPCCWRCVCAQVLARVLALFSVSLSVCEVACRAAGCKHAAARVCIDGWQAGRVLLCRTPALACHPNAEAVDVCAVASQGLSIWAAASSVDARRINRTCPTCRRTAWVAGQCGSSRALTAAAAFSASPGRRCFLQLRACHCCVAAVAPACCACRVVCAAQRVVHKASRLVLSEHCAAARRLCRTFSWSWLHPERRVLW